MISTRLSSWTIAALLAAFVPHAQAEEGPGEWRQTVFLYGMGAKIEGDAQIGPLQVEVDSNLSDFFDSLKFGAMVAYRVANDDWSFTGDLTYMNLGQNKATDQNRASATLDVEQLTAMATVGRRILPHTEALVSLAYFDLDADLRVRVLERVVEAERSVSWVDPMIGLLYDRPLSDRWRFTLRGDVGGGLDSGADLTWHALTRFTFQQSDRFSWYAGYRAISYDYDEGKGANYQHYDLTQHGPGLGLAISF